MYDRLMQKYDPELGCALHIFSMASGSTTGGGCPIEPRTSRYAVMMLVSLAGCPVR